MNGVAKSNNRPKYKDLEFRSNTELEFYKLLEKAKLDGRIYDFEYEPDPYILVEDYVDFRGKKISGIKNIIDFRVWTDKDNHIMIDTKGGSFHETDAKIKRKMWESLNPNIPYYWISKTPKYLGECWLESSSYYDYFTKVKNKWAKLYPEEKKKHWSKRKVVFDHKMWGDHFEYENILGLFYIWKETKKVKKKKE
jgi:hypothetical protein